MSENSEHKTNICFQCSLCCNNSSGCSCCPERLNNCYYITCHDLPFSIMNILCCCACCGLDCGCLIDLLCGCSHDNGDEVYSTRTGIRLC